MTRSLRTSHDPSFAGAARRPASPAVGGAKGEAGGRRRRTVAKLAPRAGATTATVAPFFAPPPTPGEAPIHDARPVPSSAGATDPLCNSPEDPTRARQRPPHHPAPVHHETASPHQPSSHPKTSPTTHRILKPQAPSPLPHSTQNLSLQPDNPPPQTAPRQPSPTPQHHPEIPKKILHRHFPKAETGPGGDAVLAIPPFPAAEAGFGPAAGGVFGGGSEGESEGPGRVFSRGVFGGPSEGFRRGRWPVVHECSNAWSVRCETTSATEAATTGRSESWPAFRAWLTSRGVSQAKTIWAVSLAPMWAARWL